MARKRVAFFSPHAGIWVHALPESYLAKCLGEGDFEVSRIACDGTFNRHCTVMEAFAVGLEQDARSKEALCRECRANAAILRPSYAGKDHVLSAYLKPGDVSEADALVAGLKEGSAQEFTYRGIEVGRIAAYEILLKFKKSTFTFDAEESAYHLVYIRNALLSLMAFERLYAEIEPDILVAYSPQYGVCGVAARYCELKGTRVYFLEGSSNIEERYKAIRVWDWEAFGLTNPALRYWDRLEAYDLGREDIERVEKHTERLLQAKSFSVYSVAASNRFDLRAHFGVPAGAKVALAAMSSYDEAYAAFVIGRFPREKYHSRVFRDQLEWIKRTTAFFADHPELFLVIRIHPRTFPTQRNAVMASEQVELTRILAELPANVKANYPSDKISIYDLYPQIDVLVTGWSATAVEAMTYKVPVVTYDRRLPSYPASIHYTGDSEEEYFANLLKAAAAGPSDAVAEAAHRWMAFSMSLGVVRHPAMLGESPLVERSRILTFAYKAARKLVPGLIKRIDARRRMRSQGEIHRLRTLIGGGGLSLYDVPRLPKTR